MSSSSIPWRRIFEALRRTTGAAPVPSVTRIATEGPDPFRVLISTIISLRTKDEVTIAASERLFAEADTPRDMLRLPREHIEKLIFPAGFYRNKAATIQEVSRLLLEKHEGSVPNSVEELTALPGVGPKTANLTLGLAFGIPAICVDTHVHRIANRMGWIRTSSPEKTEAALQTILPREFWIEINGLLVAFGKETCTPVSPWCGKCALSRWCRRIGVTRFRGGSIPGTEEQT